MAITNFTLDDAQLAKLGPWLDAQWQRMAEVQGRETPRIGCSGGAVTYEFTPTTLGCVVKVTNAVTKETLDLTNYDSW